MDKIDSFLEKNNFDSPIFYFPIRHHSPACSHHLIKTIDEYNPDIILIEGPSDTNNLIDLMADEDSEAPFAIYYSMKEKDEETGEMIHNSCYYPMLDYSPELVAIREGKKRGIKTEFIDLPYGNMTDAKESGSSESDEKKSYYNDYFMMYSSYTDSLCEKENCRSYSELWEKLFEVRGLEIDTQSFVSEMTTLCYYSRLDYPDTLLKEEATIIREQHMADKINTAKKKNKKILVVTGGFHTIAISKLVEENYKLSKLKKKKANAYLINYSFKESDQLAGYQSGMPYPAFYDEVWKSHKSGEKNPYEKTVLNMIVKIAGILRHKKEPVTISDEQAAYEMSVGLATMRGKGVPGLYELLDGIQSSFIKGELDVSSSRILSVTSETLRGSKFGKVTERAGVPPIVEDFRAISKKYRLKTEDTHRNELTLEIIAKERHRDISTFFHRLEFLEIPFVKMKAGPRYAEGIDTKLVREKWDYKMSAGVEAMLIDKSVYGSTIREATEYYLAKKLSSNKTDSGIASKYMINALVMNLENYAEEIQKSISNIIFLDSNYNSVVTAISSFTYIIDSKEMLRVDDVEKIENLLKSAYIKGTYLLSGLRTSDENEDILWSKDTKRLYLVAINRNYNYIDETLFFESIDDLLKSNDSPPTLEGVSVGLLYSSNIVDIDFLVERTKLYLYATGDIIKLSGRFLEGLFLAARDVIFYSDVFLLGIENLFTKLSPEDFLLVLPDLRLAFTHFNPREIEKIAKSIVDIHGTNEKIIDYSVSEDILILVQQIDRIAKENIEKRGFAYDI